MKFLQDLLSETTVAHDVAGAAGSLFGGGVVRRGKKTKKLSDAFRMDPSKIKSPTHNWSWRVLGEMMDSNLKGQSPESTFDPADVLSKLRDAEKQTDTEEDTVPFGLEDEDGNVIKVYVRAEQADEFESALGSMLAGEDDEGNDDDEIDGMEIAEVLFQLKDKFDIVDVKWPEIEGDEEEEQEMGGAPGGGAPAPGAEAGAGGEGGGELGLEGPPGGEEGMEGEGEGEDMDLEGEGEGEGEDEMDMEAEGGAESTLQQVIDMMKKDAEARAAEAEAKAAEARAREAEANANAAASKVKQEEQVMDAEAYEKDKKAEKDEVESLSKIARMKHDQATQREAGLAAEEDEEEIIRQRMLDRDSAARPISVQKLAAELLHRLRQGSN